MTNNSNRLVVPGAKQAIMGQQQISGSNYTK